MSNILQEYFNNRTPENTELYNAYRRGEVDIFGNPKGTPLAESAANPNLTDTSVIGTSPTVTTTSVDTATADSPPSTDDSSPNLFTESRTQTQARESVTDDTSLYEQRVNNLRNEFRKQYDVLEATGFSYVNPSDIDYIIDEQAKEFAKAGLDSIDDLGKRTVKTGVTDVEVDKVTDANGNVRYEYTTGGMIGFGGGDPKTIRVEPSTVKEVMTNMSGSFGNPQPVYIATLPNTMDELFNKKTGETVDVFAGGGTLSGDPDEPTTFGNLYSGVEGGAALNVKFAGDKPVFYPLYQDTSDRDIITPAVVASSIALSAFPGFSESIGTFLGAKSGSVAATAAGNAVIAGGTGLALGKDVEDALLAAIISYGTTFGVDALQSGKFGDYLVEKDILDPSTVEKLGIPRAFENTLPDDLGFSAEAFEMGLQPPGATTTALPGVDGLDTSLTGGLDYSLPTKDLSLAQQDFTPQTYGESSLGVGAPSNLFDQAGMGGVDTLLTGGTNLTGLSDLTGFSDALPNITDAASATTAVDNVLKLAAVGGATKEVVEEVVEEASKFIDLKEVFGDTIGGGLENLIGTGIDYAGLSALQSSLEKRGEEIQKEYEGIFKPYTVTTGFGTAEITPEGATATADAAYQPIREAQLGAATSLFEGLPATREEATAQQLEATRALTEPQRQREQERMLGTLAQRGLLGYGQTMPTVGGQRRVSPIAESILSAQELARSKEALDAQRFGLTEAGRQQQLASGLLTGAQTIDKQAMAGLTTGRDISATLQQKPELAGLSSRATYDQLVALAELDKIRGLTSGAKGLFGLPTEQGNVTANQIQQIIDLAELLKTRTATG